MIFVWDERRQAIEAHSVYDGSRAGPDRSAHGRKAVNLASIATDFGMSADAFSAALESRLARGGALSREWAAALEGSAMTSRAIVIGGKQAPQALGDHVETNWVKVGLESVPLRSHSRADAALEATLMHGRAMEWAQRAIREATRGTGGGTLLEDLTALRQQAPTRRPRMLSRLAGLLDAAGVAATTRGTIVHLAWQSDRLARFGRAGDGREAWCTLGGEIGGTRRRADWIDVVVDRTKTAVVHISELKPLSLQDLGDELATSWRKEFARTTGAERSEEGPYFGGMSDELRENVSRRLGALSRQHRAQLARYGALVLDELDIQPGLRGRDFKVYASVDWYYPPGAFSIAEAPSNRSNNSAPRSSGGGPHMRPAGAGDPGGLGDRG